MAATDDRAKTGVPVPPDQPAAAASYVDQAAALLGIRLDSECRDGVVAAFTSYRDAATLLMEFPLAIDIEQASVYTLADPSDDH
jgi:hypothetical protein